MIGLISDVHGNYPALKAVFREFEKAGCDAIYSLGDVCGYGCMVNECIDFFRENGIVSLKGNHDSYLLGEEVCSRSSVVRRCIDYQRRIIRFENFEWLKGLNPAIQTDCFFAMHGGFNNLLDEYVYDFDLTDSRLKDYPTRIFLSGHTHIQMYKTDGRFVYCNPGSVGQPRDYDSRAAYALLENGEIYLRRVEYNIDILAESMREAGFEERYYMNLYKGCKIGEA